MNERETNLLRYMTGSSRGFYAWIAFLSAIVLLGVFAYIRQIQHGLIETGLGDQISWGLYISNFVFFIGISHAGTLISAILRVTNTGWRTPITRMAEGITLVALCIGGTMIVVDMGRPDRMLNLLLYPRIQSPILWDLLGITTYFAGCLLYFYLPLIPDLGILAAHPGIERWRRRLYQALSLGWTGTATEWKLLEKAIAVMAVFIIPLAISVHTVVSWIFAMTLRPGWDSSIFGPYFVVGAIYSGAAAVVLAMCVLRRLLHLEAYLEAVHFRNLGLLLLSFCGLYLYFNINEYLTLSYKFQGGDKRLLTQLFEGPYSGYFWGAQVLCIALPLLLMLAVLCFKRYRPFLIPGLGLASFLAIAGAWVKRFVIVVPTLASPFLPAQRLPEKWMHYTPSWVEWSITAAAFAAFLLLYTVLAKLFPVVSLWETRPPELPVGEPESATSFGPRAWGSVTVAPVIVIMVALAGAARGAEPPKANKNLATTTITAEWRALPPPEVALEQTAKPSAWNTRLYLVSKPFFSLVGGHKATEENLPKPQDIELKAQVRDTKGPVAYQTVGISMNGALGSLDFGRRPTDAEGNVKLVLHDRRYGKYPITVSYNGDDDHQPARAIVLADFGPRPARALPASGVLISSDFSAGIGLPFLAFYGMMWAVFIYAFGYVVLWRMPRERVAPAKRPGPSWAP